MVQPDNAQIDGSTSAGGSRSGVKCREAASRGTRLTAASITA